MDESVGTPPVKVLVVDDQHLMRNGIVSLLSIQEGIEVVGAAENGAKAVEQAVTLRPDLVLMDVRMPVMDGIVATAEVRHRLPACQVLMLTTFDDDEYVVKAMLAGASGYLLKDIPIQDLAQAIRLAHRGIYQLEPSVAGKLMGMLSPPSRLWASNSVATDDPVRPWPDRNETDLSERELDVLRLIATGATNREIADQLVITEGTVKNHVSNILSRLGLRDRTQAAIYAHDMNLL